MSEPRMNSERRGPEDERLDAWFRAYYAACEPREVSPNFMPELWQKIDRVQNARFSFRRIAKGFVTAAAALSLILATIASLPELRPLSPLYTVTYVEVLAAHNDDVVDVARPDLADLSEVI